MARTNSEDHVLRHQIRLGVEERLEADISGHDDEKKRFRHLKKSLYIEDMHEDQALSAE